MFGSRFIKKLISFSRSFLPEINRKGMEEARKIAASLVDSPEDKMQSTTSAPRESPGEMPPVTDAKPLSKKAMKKKLRREKYKEKEREKKKNKPPKEQTCFTDTTLAETEYYFENGLRKLYPYYYTFNTWSKERWYGRRLVDVFAEEFNHYSNDDVLKAIESGKLCVNDKPASVDYVFKPNDRLNHTLHRHEKPVCADPIQIVAETGDFVAVNKPSSIPIHPCGQYRHNSLFYILGKEYGYTQLRTTYRLDRLTSGLVIFAKNHTMTNTVSQLVANREVEKEYVCRVDGEFPSGEIVCAQPLGILSYKVGLYKVDPNGKESKTTFQRMSYNGKTSVVKCRPHTGRTHQIRVHLQYLGYPITNDYAYNGAVWGPHKGKGGDWGKSEEQLINDLMKKHARSNFIVDNHNTENIFEEDKNGNIDRGTLDEQEDRNSDCNKASANTEGEKKYAVNNSATQSQGQIFPQGEGHAFCDPKDSELSASLSADSREPPQKKRKTEVELDTPQTAISDEIIKKLTSGSEASSVSDDKRTAVLRPAFDPAKLVVDPNCTDCKIKTRDPRPGPELVMYLHALRYKAGSLFDFSTELPAWAAEDWKEPDDI